MIDCKKHAEVAELADAPALGAGGTCPLEVRLLSSAPAKSLLLVHFMSPHSEQGDGIFPLITKDNAVRVVYRETKTSL